MTQPIGQNSQSVVLPSSQLTLQLPELVAQYNADRSDFIRILGGLGEQLGSLKTQVGGLSQENQSLKVQLDLQNQTIHAKSEEISDLATRVDTVGNENAALRNQVEERERTFQAAVLQGNEERRNLKTAEQKANLKASKALLEKELAELEEELTIAYGTGGFGLVGGALHGAFFGPVGALIGAAVLGVSTSVGVASEKYQKQAPRRKEIGKELTKIGHDLAKL